MKRIVKILFVVAISFVLFFGDHCFTYAAGATLAGPSTVRAGDTITLSLNITDSSKYALEGKLNYDDSQVTFSSATCNLEGWKVETSDEIIVAYDDAMSNPLNGTQTVIQLVFKVNSNLETGTTIRISIDDLLVTDGNAESALGDAVYSISVARPLSGNADLSELSVDGCSLSPAFNKGTTSYSVGEVDYSVSELDIRCKVEDANAKYSISGNNLKVGSNTVTITVTAENGATKKYTISVTRKQDPNYTKSSNADLKDISLNVGILSPTFDAGIGEYVVYLPFEFVGEKFNATGKAADTKAQGVSGGVVDALAEGANYVTITVTAEDGTQKSYAIIVMVMPKYEGGEPEVVEPQAPEGDESELPGDEDASEDVDAPAVENEGNEKDGGIWVTIGIAVVIAALIGALVYVLFFWGKRNNR